MHATDADKERILLAGVHTGKLDFLNDTTDESMAELEELCDTAGGEVVCHVVQNKQELETSTYMGEGKLKEIREAIDNLNIDTVVFDDSLSPIQLKNISEVLGCKVLDRSMLILDIFAMRAMSMEGKIQVELAQNKYMLPRIRGMGTQLSRTGAGIGTRGPGETKLETDRRHIRRRIHALEEELKEIKKHRQLLRQRRKKDAVITVAIVGYTNAGKSSLLNKLTDANVLAENKLFATLDATFRGLTLSDNRKVLLVDTVGFIRKLPHHLIEAFKSTLEEATLADVVIHVVDAASIERENHISVAESVLSDINASDKPTILVYNKIDKLGEPVFNAYKNAEKVVMMSVKTGEGINELISAIEDLAPGKKQEFKILIPYEQGAIVSKIHSSELVLAEEYTEKGTLMQVMLDGVMYDKVREYVVEE